MAPQSAREKIIQAAMELFWLKGYNSTSIADLLSRTQLNSGSLYHVFPSKQDVLIGVLEAYRDGIEEMLLEPAWGQVDDPIEKIFALLERLSHDDRRNRLHLWLPDRVAGAGAARARSAACAICWRRTSRIGRVRSSDASSARAKAAARNRQESARAIRADGDGRRRDAGAHASATSHISTAP